jgi:uncharacterized protein
VAGSIEVYADTSLLVALVLNEEHSNAARRFVVGTPKLLVSDLAEVEFSAVIARDVRMRTLTRARATEIFEAFDNWRRFDTWDARQQPEDMASASGLVRLADLGLRAPDALHLALAMRLGMPIVTFDAGLARAADLVGAAAVIPA